MKINKSVMTPMLVVGTFVASGIVALIEPNIGEVGHLVHEITMFLGDVLFAYGVYGY